MTDDPAGRDGLRLDLRLELDSEEDVWLLRGALLAGRAAELAEVRRRELRWTAGRRHAITLSDRRRFVICYWQSRYPAIVTRRRAGHEGGFCHPKLLFA